MAGSCKLPLRLLIAARLTNRRNTDYKRLSPERGWTERGQNQRGHAGAGQNQRPELISFGRGIGVLARPRARHYDID